MCTLQIVTHNFEIMKRFSTQGSKGMLSRPFNATNDCQLQ